MLTLIDLEQHNSYQMLKTIHYNRNNCESSIDHLCESKV